MQIASARLAQEGAGLVRLRVLRVLRVVEEPLIGTATLHARDDIQHARHLLRAQQARAPHDPRPPRHLHVDEGDLTRPVLARSVAWAFARGGAKRAVISVPRLGSTGR
eukprot:COSAG03_NODE_322_length_8987_cov_10.806321_5_plen_108_part_00